MWFQMPALRVRCKSSLFDRRRESLDCGEARRRGDKVVRFVRGAFSPAHFSLNKAPQVSDGLSLSVNLLAQFLRAARCKNMRRFQPGERPRQTGDNDHSHVDDVALRAEILPGAKARARSSGVPHRLGPKRLSRKWNNVMRTMSGRPQNITRGSRRILAFKSVYPPPPMVSVSRETSTITAIRPNYLTGFSRGW